MALSDDPVESLLFEELLDRVPHGWIEYLPRLLEVYKSLAPEDHEALTRHARQLREHLGADVPSETPQLWLELVSLRAQWREGLGDLWRRPSRHPALSASELDSSSSWLQAARETVGFWEGLSPPQRAALLGLAGSDSGEGGAPAPAQAPAHKPLAASDGPLALFLLLGRAFATREASSDQDPEAASQARLDQYRALSQDQARRLAARAVDVLDTGIPDAEDAVQHVLLHLACLQPGSLAGLHGELVRRRFFYPAELYRGADAASRDALIQLLTEATEDTEEVSINHALSALAWIGDEAVQATFRAWRSAPPPWRSGLHVPPEDYAHEAGWELTPDGRRRDLFHRECFGLVPYATGAPAPGTPVGQIALRADRCPWCGRQLTSLLDLDLRTPQLAFLGLDGSRLRIGACGKCSAFATIFWEVDWHGRSEWSALNQRPEFLGRDDVDYENDPELLLALGLARWAFETHQFVTERGASQVGGHPCWIDDSTYPECPRCGVRMTFIAQLAGSDLHGGEGMDYAFLCRDCRLVTTVYQQT